jgi:predicted RecA/RadA family phage recombinase
MGAQLFHPATEREFTASANLNSGDIILSTDGKAVVVTELSGVANGRVGRGEIAGVYDVDAVSSDTYAVGVLVYLTEATQVAATSAGSGKILIGVCAYAKTAGQLVVKVDLNGTRTSSDDFS